MAIKSVTEILANREAIRKGTVKPELSPLQKQLADKKAEDSKQVNFFKSETYFRAKANQLKYMMALYSNLGLNEEYKAVEAEAKDIVNQYTKLYGRPKTASTTDTTA
jgi:glutamate/tyrosine decarboxylase-like PLP-dependent enzyme